MRAQRIQMAGAGRAYQAVAQSSATAVGDGTDYLRNLSTIAVTAAGVGMAMLASGTEAKKAQEVLDASQQIVANTVLNYQKICTAAIAVATEFPRSFGA